MKAPDKIYIQTNAGEAFSSKWTTIPFRDFENTEYIRKEALLEWAKDTLKLAVNTSPLTDDSILGYRQGIKALIDKIESL